MSNDKFHKFVDEGKLIIDKDLDGKNIRLQTPESKKEQKNAAVKAPEPAKPIRNHYLTGSSKEENSNSYLKQVNERLSFLGKYFDVEQDEIKDKLMYSVIPFNTNFQPLAEKKPDLYGPFWIYATLVFMVAVAGNISNYIAHPDKAVFKYNFSFVPISATYVRLS